MRADIVWPAVWGTCFIGGVIVGSTGPVDYLAFGSSSPKLRGGKNAAVEKSLLSKNAVEREEPSDAQNNSNIEAAFIIKDEQQQQEDGATHKAEAQSVVERQQHRTLGSSEEEGVNSDFDSSHFGLHQLEEEPVVVYGESSKLAQRARSLNGGLWGPNEEEEEEIAKELVRLRKAFKAPPAPSSSQGEEERAQDEYPFSSGSYSYDFEAGGMSYSYDDYWF